MSNNSYIGYQAMVTDVTTGLSALQNTCRNLNMAGQADELNKISDRLKNHIFSVGIMGEFKRGKSTVINALLGQDIVPADVVPCSATLNYVRWDTEKRAEIHYKDGSAENVSVEELANYVTKITSESQKTSANVEDAVVYYPCAFCQNGVQIVDTPGLNDDDRMTAISENVIPTLDAIIMVITAQSPFSQSEAEFVRNKVMTSDLGRIIFVVNKIDLTDEDERPRLLRHIKERIQSSVLEKTALVYGEDSEEYKATKDKIGDVRLIAVSAKKALKGKINNKPEMTDESGYNEFETALSYLLTEERGLLDLIHPVNQIMSISKEALQTIETRLDALAMSSAEFEEIQKDSIARIEEARTNKKAEIKGLKAKSNTLFYDFQPDVCAAYEDVAMCVESFAANYPIKDSDISSEDAARAFSQKMSAEINKEIEGALAISTERLQHKIQERLGNDVKGLENFGQVFMQNIAGVRLNISKGSGKTSLGELTSNTVVDFAGMVGSALLSGGAVGLPGLGGLIAGYREHGMKGAIVGGGSGLFAGALAGTLLSFAMPMGLPFMLIMGMASSFGGKAVTNLLLGKKEKPTGGENAIEYVRNQLLDSVHQSMNDLRQSGVLEDWLKQTSNTMYSTIADNINQEWENSLNTLEDTLTQVKIDLQMNEEARKNTENDLKEYADKIRNILESIQPIYEKLNKALNQAE